MTAGFDPEAFWRQSPRSFIAAMEAKSRAVEIRRDELMSLAWHSGAFGAAAQAGKLKSLERYLINKPKKRGQTADELFAAFQSLADKGRATVRQRPN